MDEARRTRSPAFAGDDGSGLGELFPVIVRRASAEAIQPSPVAAARKAMRLRTMLCIALRRMAPGDHRACRHPSRRKPSPCGRRPAPQDEVRKPGDDRFYGIDPLAQVSPALDIEAADDAFRLRSSSWGEQAGSNPTCTLLDVRRHAHAVGWRTGRTAGSRPTFSAFPRAPDAKVTQPGWLGFAASRSLW